MSLDDFFVEIFRVIFKVFFDLESKLYLGDSFVIWFFYKCFNNYFFS